jgi:hypothetical protein
MKTCGTCTQCCNGTLTGNAFEKNFSPGKPCIAVILDKGCSRYEERPLMCSNFSCAWLDDPDMPDWMKPEFSNAIITTTETNGITYAEFTESPYKKTTTEVLIYFIEWALKKDAFISFRMINYSVDLGKYSKNNNL